MNDSDFKAHMSFADTQAKERWLCIDPGTTKTGWVIFDPLAEKPVEAGWEDNATVLWRIENMNFHDRVIMETFAAQGMPLGDSSLQTVRWEGRFVERALMSRGIEVDHITRRAIKIAICGSSRAKDSNIRAAMVDMYAFAWSNIGNGLGVKDNPSPLACLRSGKGATAHTFAALAVAAAWRIEHWRRP